MGKISFRSVSLGFPVSTFCFPLGFLFFCFVSCIDCVVCLFLVHDFRISRRRISHVDVKNSLEGIRGVVERKFEKCARNVLEDIFQRCLEAWVIGRFFCFLKLQHISEEGYHYFGKRGNRKTHYRRSETE